MAAMHSHGLTYTWSGTPAFSGAVKSLDGFSLERTSVDKTHLNSTGGWREFMPGLKNAGELSGEFVIDGSTAPILSSGAWDGTTATNTLRITWPLVGSQITQGYWECQAFPIKYQPKGPLDSQIVASITWKLTGVPTYSAAA